MILIGLLSICIIVVAVLCYAAGRRVVEAILRLMDRG